jgi:hypothetical protein
MTRAKWLVLSLLLPSCSDGGSKDASVDIDNGSCGDMIRFTGEYVDWDTDRGFCGVFNAGFQVQGGGAMDTTAPNGRFDLCLPNQPVTVLDITPPAQASACSMPAGSYTMPGIAVATKSVISSGAFWSGRAFVMGRQAFDPAKAQVFVHVNGTPRKISIAAAHGPAQAVVTDTWAPGDTGHEVFFPDVEIGAGQTKITASDAIVPDNIPLVAGTMTNVSIVLR